MGIRINRVYTRSGDDGSTGLVGGRRVSKSNLRVWGYGEIDEVNSSLGVAKEELSEKLKELRPVIEFLQQELFDLGAELATPAGDEYPSMWKVGPAHIERLEKLCDQYGDKLPELKSFILPGGSKVAAALHISRCITRRAERLLVELMEHEGPNFSRDIVRYVNRLSDLLFILARYSLAEEGKEVPPWKQERDRVGQAPTE